ncbi:hypothetical protein NL676_020701 [Syzygium grande]|nr:hypothetical protein NL676_020701 [Syzygium grande]
MTRPISPLSFSFPHSAQRTSVYKSAGPDLHCAELEQQLLPFVTLNRPINTPSVWSPYDDRTSPPPPSPPPPPFLLFRPPLSPVCLPFLG